MEDEHQGDERLEERHPWKLILGQKSPPSAQRKQRQIATVGPNEWLFYGFTRNASACPIPHVAEELVSSRGLGVVAVIAGPDEPKSKRESIQDVKQKHDT